MQRWLPDEREFTACRCFEFPRRRIYVWLRAIEMTCKAVPFFLKKKKKKSSNTSVAVHSRRLYPELKKTSCLPTEECPGFSSVLGHASCFTRHLSSFIIACAKSGIVLVIRRLRHWPLTRLAGPTRHLGDRGVLTGSTRQEQTEQQTEASL